MKSPPNAQFAKLTIGVLELQGDFAEHTSMLRRCGAGKVVGVRLPQHLNQIDALVIPGGESTVISKLLVDLNMMPHVQRLARDGLPMFGTCAGCILLSSTIRQRPQQPSIAAMDISVDRNAYGSQIHSFETNLKATSAPFAKGAPLRVVQIRAPAIVQVGDHVQVLASHNDTPILVRQGSMLACTFHPELTEDTRVHHLFLQMVAQAVQSSCKT